MPRIFRYNPRDKCQTSLITCRGRRVSHAIWRDRDYGSHYVIRLPFQSNLGYDVVTHSCAPEAGTDRGVRKGIPTRARVSRKECITESIDGNISHLSSQWIESLLNILGEVCVRRLPAQRSGYALRRSCVRTDVCHGRVIVRRQLKSIHCRLHKPRAKLPVHRWCLETAEIWAPIGCGAGIILRGSQRCPASVFSPAPCTYPKTGQRLAKPNCLPGVPLTFSLG